MSAHQSTVATNTVHSSAIENTTEENKAIARRFNQEGWGTNRDWQTVWNEIVAPDAIQHFNDMPEPIVGLEANKAFNMTLFKAFLDITSTLEDIVAEGDRVVYRTTLQGKHQGEFMGIPPTGKSVKVKDFTLIRVCNHRIVEWWYTCNLLAVMQQLGLS